MEEPVGLTVGILAPYLAGSFFGSVISAVQRVVTASGGRVVAISTGALGADDHRYHGGAGGDLPPVAWGRAAGFVSVANAAKPDYLVSLRQAGKPVVTLSQHYTDFACPAVVADNRGGVRRAVEHLLEHGHTRIGFAGCLDQFDARERYAAYMETLAAHGAEPGHEMFFEASDHLEPGGRDAGRRMLAAGLPCTAVVAGTDMNAIGLMDVLKQSGCRLPRGLAIVGFDDIPGAGLLSPSLTSVCQRLDAMGALAARLLLRQIGGEDVEPGPHIVEARLVVRESCGCSNGPIPSVPVEHVGHGGPARDLAVALQAASAEVPCPVADPGQQPVPEPLGEEAARLVRVVEGMFRDAVSRELTALELLELGQACQGLYALFPGQPARDAIVAFADGLSRQSSEAGTASGAWAPGEARLAGPLRLDRCVTEVRLALARAMLTELSEAYFGIRQSDRDKHLISMDLLRGHEEDPRCLAWLSRTDALAAVLGLWRHEVPSSAAAQPAGGGPEPAGTSPGTPARHLAGPDGERAWLDVAGTFDRSGGELVLGPTSYSAECFPPPALFSRAGPGNLVLVFPVRNDDRYWGLLSAVVPMSDAFFELETLFQWEALLCEALDFQDVVIALRDQREQLASSWERERQMAMAVKESEQRYALAARAANDGLWDWDVTAGTVYYSARWKRMLGYRLNAVGKSPDDWFDRVHPEDRPDLVAAVGALRRGEQTSLHVEHRIMAADGSYRWALCRGLAVPGRGKPATRIVGFLTDTTERRSLEERLRHQALHDELTGLPNRTLFIDRLSQAIANFRRKPQSSYAVFWLDLDGFKILNDSLGHVAGDKLLVQVAERVKSHVRETDTAARFGGDEFALLLHGTTDLDFLSRVAGRLLAHLSEPYDVDGHRVVVTASIGIATSMSGYERTEEVLRDADIAMYRAKLIGPGTFVRFDAAMFEGAVSRMETETRLRRAIELGQLELYYQPLVFLNNDQIVGFEALVRWHDPDLGIILPLEFLRVAEESGLIVPMGQWVQREACRQLEAWQSEGLLDRTALVGVNLSNREFWDPLLLENLDRVLSDTGASVESLIIEITEGVVMESFDEAVRILRQLRERGIQVAIDDFGTGYSSLQALHQLPIDSLKMDRSFVTGLGRDKRSVVLARTILQMGKNLGLRVVAEGIETAAEKSALLRLKCGLGQGFLFSRPMPADEAGALLATQSRTGHGESYRQGPAVQRPPAAGGGEGTAGRS
jgi:diguanylate cyclase (GGDEF)-like protein/PAS domain S-box-containing protein